MLICWFAVIPLFNPSVSFIFFEYLARRWCENKFLSLEILRIKRRTFNTLSHIPWKCEKKLSINAHPIYLHSLSGCGSYCVNGLLKQRFILRISIVPHFLLTLDYYLIWVESYCGLWYCAFVGQLFFFSQYTFSIFFSSFAGSSYDKVEQAEEFFQQVGFPPLLFLYWYKSIDIQLIHWVLSPKSYEASQRLLKHRYYSVVPHERNINGGKWPIKWTKEE